MCGIVGILSYRGPVDVWRGHIERATDLMARRGPDASGVWSDGACCLLGFRRLSVLDLSEAANQPMVSRDGRYVLVYNGELYNFRDIRKALEDRGVVFRSTGDAEVVLYALAEFGARALESFNGMFALAFYDTHARRLLLARDHAAIKPLYVLYHPAGLLFASQYDQILSHPWARERSVSQGSLGLYLNFGYIPPPFALLDGSAALEAGTWQSVDSSGLITTGRYFSFPRAPTPDLGGAQAVEAVDAAIASAVRRQMVSDVPIGVLLSGGIDSPLVAAHMRGATNAAIPAFTLGTSGDRLDESPDARRYADALNLHHVVRHVVPSDVLSLVDEIAEASSEPHDDYSMFPTALISRVARERVTVALSGDGGDDLFWGYPERMIRPIRRASASAAGGWLRRQFDARGDSPGSVQRRRHRFVDAGQLTAVFPGLPALPDDFTLFNFESRHPDALAMWLRWNEYSGHLAGVLQKVDRASMRYSLEVRVPLLDREVVDVATRIDWRSAVDLRHELGKLPLRASLERRVGFQTRTKRGFEVPMASWLRGPLRPLFQDLVLPRRDLVGLPVNTAALARIFSRHLGQLENCATFLWRVLNLALWETRYLPPAPTHA